MKFTCDQCSTRYSISDEKVDGKVLKIRCKVCEFTMVVRGSDSRTGGSVSAVTAAASSIMEPIYEIEWYAAPDGQQVGPVPLERIRAMIRSGILTAESVVWNENLSDWTPAAEIDELKAMFASKQKAPPPLPPKLQKADVASPVSLTPTEPSVAPAGRMVSPDATIPNQQSERGDATTALSVDSPQSAVGPVTDRATLQYSSPDHSEPGLPSSESLVPAADALYVPAATLDLPESDDEPSAPSDTFASLSSESSSGATSGQASLVSQADGPEDVGDSTELMSLVGLTDGGGHSGTQEAVPEYGGAALKDQSTRKIERPESDREGSVAPLAADPVKQADGIESDSVSALSIHGLPAIDDVSDAPVAVDQVEAMPDDVPTLNISSQSNAINISSEPLPTFPTQPSSVATERRAGPKVGKSSSSVSPGLVVAACLIGTTAMICAVIYFSAYRDKVERKRGVVVQTQVDASTRVASAQIVDAGLSAPSVKPMVLPRGAGQDETDSKQRLKTEADKPVVKLKPSEVDRRKSIEGKSTAKAAKPDRKKSDKDRPRGVRKGATKTRSSKAKASRTQEKARPSESKKNAVASSPKSKSSSKEQISSKQKKKAEPRTRRNFMLAGGPSSSIPDPTLKTQKQAANPGRQTNGLSQGVVNGVASRYVGAMQGCYNRHLKKDPTFNPGRLMLRFQIRPTGLTANVRVLGKGGSSLSSGILSKCLKRLVKRWRFPTFQGAPFDTHFPLVFQRQF
ncbi:MAG: GYF domain-containing protein [Myxococcota bacterium]|nr:GYF domain-containing protein [Myxococcota bacterium]